ncbi:HD domain-containing protein [Georgenia sp. EYE_87]|uniref:HD domain-containing protein n=1 Tax=Georgenia sp. EYE_87 TaxID=2853448 RepID=UPI00200435D1|nr:HD domain-containing protein [Georgenia sp. EYE_87]MCK6210117.1 HD domain-containing protein [Georgenia sp. EYE_87]
MTRLAGRPAEPAGARPTSLLGRDIGHLVPPGAAVPGLVTLTGCDRAVWESAAGYLRVRDNDSHTLYSYGLATALLAQTPEARAEVVLPAILLHDTGWSAVPEEHILEAIAPRARRPELVRAHEIAGARIAREVLTDLGFASADIEEIVAIVDGHDSRAEALSVDDACVKDADKLWRITPHGLRTVQRWFGLDADEALRLVSIRTHAHLHTAAARAMAGALGALASIDLTAERAALADG